MAYPSVYPTDIDAYTLHTDGLDNVMAVHVNELQSAILAIEAKLGTGQFHSAIGDGIGWGFKAGAAGDVLWYRSAADTWRTPDSVVIDGTFTIGGNLITFPAAGTVALLGTANVFTATQTISNTAPSFVMTDTTGAAKSLTIAVDANLANIRESAGAAGSLLVLDLANARVGIGLVAPISPLHIKGLLPRINIEDSTGGGSNFALISRANRLDIGEQGVSNIISILTTGNVKIAGTTALRGTTEGTNHLDIFNGTAPVGTLANGISIYSAVGECWIMDAGGTATQQTPHDKDGKWIFYSKNTVTGKVLQIDMERMMKALNARFKWDFVKEYIEQ